MKCLNGKNVGKAYNFKEDQGTNIRRTDDPQICMAYEGGERWQKLSWLQNPLNVGNLVFVQFY